MRPCVHAPRRNPQASYRLEQARRRFGRSRVPSCANPVPSLAGAWVSADVTTLQSQGSSLWLRATKKTLMRGWDGLVSGRIAAIGTQGRGHGRPNYGAYGSLELPEVVSVIAIASGVFWTKREVLAPGGDPEFKSWLQNL